MQEHVSNETVSENSTSTMHKILKDVGHFCRDLLFVACIAGLVSFIILKFIFIFAYVPTGSMKPTINEGDRVLVLRFLKNVPFERGDFIVFEGEPYIDEDITLIKRVVGLPGERVKIVEGTVYINGVPIKEDYVVNQMAYNMPEIVVPQDEYFVLGDNRADSYDARFWDDQTVSKEDVIGEGKLLFKQ